MNPKLHLKSEIVDSTTGEILCGCGCGIVLLEKTVDVANLPLAKEPEDTHYKSENPNHHDKGLGTIISHSYIQRNKPSRKQRQSIDNIRVWQERVRGSGYHDRRLIRYLQVLAELESDYNLTQFQKNEVIAYLRKLENMQILHGKSVPMTLTVLVSFTKKLHGIPFNPKKYKKQFKFKWTTYNKYFREFQESLKIDTADLIASNVNILYVIGNKVNASRKTIESSKAIMNYCKDKGLFCTKQPSIVAATCLYVVSLNYDERILLDDLADATPCTAASIRTLKEEMKDVFAIFKMSIDFRKSIRTYQERCI
ncbi:MAG: hypothetical protein K5785_00760 [Nitrosarchaeum sp.]|nr:hypothetical protein [Nitrosarchaeum sp.]